MSVHIQSNGKSCTLRSKQLSPASPPAQAVSTPPRVTVSHRPCGVHPSPHLPSCSRWSSQSEQTEAITESRHSPYSPFTDDSLLSPTAHPSEVSRPISFHLQACALTASAPCVALSLGTAGPRDQSEIGRNVLFSQRLTPTAQPKLSPHNFPALIYIIFHRALKTTLQGFYSVSLHCLVISPKAEISVSLCISLPLFKTTPGRMVCV